LITYFQKLRQLVALLLDHQAPLSSPVAHLFRSLALEVGKLVQFIPKMTEKENSPLQHPGVYYTKPFRPKFMDKLYK
jgi:hypothetical protein